MKKILPLLFSFFLITVIIGALNSTREVNGAKKVFAQEGPSSPPCPHFLVEDGDDADTEPDYVHTTPFGSECRLHQDVIGLVEPLKLESGIKLDCKGHKILPSLAGQPNNPATAQFDPAFSQPQLAIFLNGAQGTTIENCVIEGGFDFGILAINSKVPEDVKNDTAALKQLRNKIFKNTIKAWYVPVHLMASDNFEIKLNHFSYFVRGGAAILLHYDSDMNAIKNNTIICDLSTFGAPTVPGPTGFITGGGGAPGGLTSNQVVTNPIGAVIVAQNYGPDSTVFNVVIEGNPPNLHQLSLPYIPELNEDFPADNIVEGNDISFNIGSFPGAELSSESGIVAPCSLRTTVRSNKIQSPPGIGIRDGPITVRKFPGKCTLDSNRHCLTNADCFIEGIDAISNGTCTDPPPTDLLSVDWSSSYFLIENNEITGPFLGGISMLAKNSAIRGNRIIGPLNPGGLGGIALRGKTGLETGAVVTRNTVSNVSIALRLDRTFGGLTASFFDARISLNDFTQYTTAALLTGGAFQFPMELSVDDQGNVCGIYSAGCRGNYWNLDNCTLGGFHPNKVSPLGSAVDSNPYGEEVGVIVTDSGPCDMVSKTCSGNPAIGCATDANCIVYTERPEPPPPLTCPEQGF